MEQSKSDFWHLLHLGSSPVHYILGWLVWNVSIKYLTERNKDKTYFNLFLFATLTRFNNIWFWEHDWLSDGIKRRGGAVSCRSKSFANAVKDYHNTSRSIFCWLFPPEMITGNGHSELWSLSFIRYQVHYTMVLHCCSRAFFYSMGPQL